MTEVIRNADDFSKKVLNPNLGLVLVDFFADWCGPCRMLAPILESFEKDNPDMLQIYKVNIEENEQVATEYGIISIPTLLLFKGGKMVMRHTGIVDAATIASWVEKYE